jgi:hypothetical protein
MWWVSEDGVAPDLEKVRAAEYFKTPDSVTELPSFLGLVSYYRRFIPKFSKTA